MMAARLSISPWLWTSPVDPVITGDPVIEPVRRSTTSIRSAGTLIDPGQYDQPILIGQ